MANLPIKDNPTLNLQMAVSYTHLDVYKRQVTNECDRKY